jgi:anaerobic ribonucleoside-triphosphate reductase activating protein
MNTSMRVNNLVFSVHSKILGYSSNRAVLWMQGCNIGCKGCTSTHTWDHRGGYDLSIKQIITELDRHHCRGITITGGEPTEQPQALLELCHAIREKFGKNFEIVVYSGLAREQAREKCSAIFELVDLSIFGPFISELESNPLAGSSNQLVEINEKSNFLEQYGDWELWNPGIQIFPLNATEYLLVGIPDTRKIRHAMQESKSILNAKKK